MDPLPVDEALPRLKEVLRAHNAAVLVAPPGAGKTTHVPLAFNVSFREGTTVNTVYVWISHRPGR